MSKKSESPASYNDVKTVMDTALKVPGLKYETKTHGAAVNFKQRCNQYRNLLRDIARENLQNVPGFRAETAYDVLVIRQQNEAGDFDRKGKILVFDHVEPLGRMINPETGEEIRIEGVTDIIREQ